MSLFITRAEFFNCIKTVSDEDGVICGRCNFYGSEKLRYVAPFSYQITYDVSKDIEETVVTHVDGSSLGFELFKVYLVNLDEQALAASFMRVIAEGLARGDITALRQFADWCQFEDFSTHDEPFTLMQFLDTNKENFVKSAFNAISNLKYRPELMDVYIPIAFKHLKANPNDCQTFEESAIARDLQHFAAIFLDTRSKEAMAIYADDLTAIATTTKNYKLVAILSSILKKL